MQRQELSDEELRYRERAASEVVSGSGALATLRDVHTARMELWALCTRCGRARHYHPSPLRGVIDRRLREGEDTLINAALLFRCSQCGARRVAFVPYAPDAVG